MSFSYSTTIDDARARIAVVNEGAALTSPRFSINATLTVSGADDVGIDLFGSGSLSSSTSGVGSDFQITSEVAILGEVATDAPAFVVYADLRPGGAVTESRITFTTAGERYVLEDIPTIKLPSTAPIPSPIPALDDLAAWFDDSFRGYDRFDTLVTGLRSAEAGNQVMQGLGTLQEPSVEFSGPSTDYRLAFGDDGIVVSDLVTGRDGNDLLLDIETVSFADDFKFGDEAGIDLSLIDAVTSLSEAELRAFVEMYVAYFDRAPDAFGLYYWGTRLSDGMTLPEIAASFFDQPESRNVFPDAEDNASLVDAAYSNLLERAPDLEGRMYWIAALENGDVSRAEFMLAIINGAKAATGAPDDVATISDKADIGMSYAVISGLSDPGDAKTVMRAYDRDAPEASLARAQTLIEAFRTEATDADGVDDELTIPIVGIFEDPLAVA
jgi:hypothetical protein